MTLLNVALVPGFMTNLVSLSILNSKDVHWNSRFPDCLERNGNTFCFAHVIGKYIYLEKTSNYQSVVFSTKKSIETPTTTFTKADLHQVLRYASPEVIKHVVDVIEGIIVDPSVPCPSTIQCEAYSLSKATEIISQRSNVEDKANGKPFDRISWDLIPMFLVFNGDK
jgi:hypothetical protein